jgi:hypothetical protein
MRLFIIRNFREALAPWMIEFSMTLHVSMLFCFYLAFGAPDVKENGIFSLLVVLLDMVLAEAEERSQTDVETIFAFLEKIANCGWELFFAKLSLLTGESKENTHSSLKMLSLAFGTLIVLTNSLSASIIFCEISLRIIFPQFYFVFSCNSAIQRI